MNEKHIANITPPSEKLDEQPEGAEGTRWDTLANHVPKPLETVPVTIEGTDEENQKTARHLKEATEEARAAIDTGIIVEQPTSDWDFGGRGKHHDDYRDRVDMVNKALKWQKEQVRKAALDAETTNALLVALEEAPKHDERGAFQVLHAVKFVEDTLNRAAINEAEASDDPREAERARRYYAERPTTSLDDMAARYDYEEDVRVRQEARDAVTEDIASAIDQSKSDETNLSWWRKRREQKALKIAQKMNDGIAQLEGWGRQHDNYNPAAVDFINGVLERQRTGEPISREDMARGKEVLGKLNLDVQQAAPPPPPNAGKKSWFGRFTKRKNRR